VKARKDPQFVLTEEEFETAFGIRPSQNPRLANLEQQIVDQHMDVVRRELSQFRTVLQQLEARAKKERSLGVLKDLHRRTAEAATSLEHAQDSYNLLAALARKFGLKPLVYRSARRYR
jgi:hypothetical protein